MDTAQSPITNHQSPTSLNLPEQTYITLLISLQYSQLANLKLPNGKVLDRKDRINEIIAGLIGVNNLLPQESKATTAEINQLCQELKGSVILPKTIDRVFELFQKYLSSQRGPGNVPTAKIEGWKKQQAEWQRQKDESLCRQADANSQTTLVIPDYAKLDLEAQFRLINQIKEKVKTIPKNKAWQKLADTEQEEALDKVSEAVLRDVLQQKELASEDIIYESINKLCDEDIQVKTAFSKQEQNQLSLELAGELQTPLVQPLIEKAKQNQEKIQENEIETAPSREQLRNVLKNEFDYSDRQLPELENLLRRIETNWPQNPNPTQAETQKAISKSLRFRDYVQLKNKGIAEETLTKKLTPVVRSYYVGTPLVQKEQNLNYQGITFWTAFWSKYTKVDPIVLQNLRRGLTIEKIDKELTRNFASVAKTEKLRQLKEQIQSFQERDFKKLPWFLRKQIAWAQAKARLFGLLEKTNPFCLAFYEVHFPKGFNFINTRAKSLHEVYQYIIYKTPAGWLIHPFKRFNHEFWKLSYNLRLKAYRKYAQIVSKKISNRKRRRFLVSLPRNIGNYVSPRYWIGQARRWVGRKTAQAVGKLLIKIGTKLGKDLLVKAGKELIKSGLKQAITKGLAYLLGSALGITSGGVGTVIAIALAVIDFGIMALKFVFSREGREILKKILEPLAAVLAAGIIYLVKLIFSLPFTFAGAALGMVVAGPLGALAGGAIGFVIDSTILPLFRGASGVLAGWTAGAGPATAVTAGGLTAGVPAAAAGVGAAASGFLASIGPASFAIIVPAGIFGLSLFNIINNNSSLVHVQSTPPLIENPAPGDTAESVNFKVQKKANKNTFTNSGLASGLKVIYTVTITPKSGAITINNIKDEVTVFSKSSPPLPQITLTSNSEDPQGKTINAATSFTYEATLNESYKDSRIKNIITVSVVTAAGLQDKLSAYETINIGSPPSVDCPVQGFISCYSYSNPASGCHHGDNSYENIVCPADNPRGPCCIMIPVFDTCKGPTAENKIESSGAVSMCYGKGYNCPDFGKAVDIHAPGGTQVVLPSIGGASVVWNYKSKLGCSVGRGQKFSASSGGHNYEIMICHLNESSPDCTQCPAGSTIGTVHPNAAHVHIELSIDGGYVMPEEFMCQGL